MIQGIVLSQNSANGSSLQNKTGMLGILGALSRGLPKYEATRSITLPPPPPNPPPQSDASPLQGYPSSMLPVPCPSSCTAFSQAPTVNSLGPRDPKQERHCHALLATDPLVFPPSDGKSEALTTTPQCLRTDSHILYL